VVALKHSEGIKHKVLFQEQKLTNTKSLQYTPSLFLSSVSLYSLTHNSISSACYLYTNSKQDISTFKCKGGWWLAAYSWWLAAGGWAVTTSGCLP